MWPAETVYGVIVFTSAGKVDRVHVVFGTAGQADQYAVNAHLGDYTVAPLAFDDTPDQTGATAAV